MYNYNEKDLMKEDVEVEFHFYEERELFDGYRPAHQVTEDYLTTGLHRYKHAGATRKDDIGSITFISPEHYPNSLWVGKEIVFYDGPKPKGYAVVTRILNKTLER
jgi:elongation factor Tu